MSIFCLYKFFCFYGVKFLPFSTGPAREVFNRKVCREAQKIAMNKKELNGRLNYFCVMAGYHAWDGVITIRG